MINKLKTNNDYFLAAQEGLKRILPKTIFHVIPQFQGNRIAHLNPAEVEPLRIQPRVEQPPPVRRLNDPPAKEYAQKARFALEDVRLGQPARKSHEDCFHAVRLEVEKPLPHVVGPHMAAADPLSEQYDR